MSNAMNAMSTSVFVTMSVLLARVLAAPESAGTRGARFYGVWVPAAVFALGVAAVYAWCAYKGGTVIWKWRWTGPAAYCAY